MIQNQLNYLMKKNEMSSLSELSKKSGISKSVLHGYLQGSMPSLKNLKKLSQFFKVLIEYLIGMESEEVIFCKDLKCLKDTDYQITLKITKRGSK